ncbi:unnamed protein product [Schistocephalus solidus]|uniref:Reverse transcriptase domain-containing protein n=1 Tax=Schistocephalus solidus TaxID=70667 RepID=A0A183S7Z8_SCHSO|nr:unnamed protein product [Schistocephalus solidus]
MSESLQQDKSEMDESLTEPALLDCETSSLVSTPENEGTSQHPIDRNKKDVILKHILFPELLVERELRNLKEAKSSGLDDLPAKFLKELASELFKPPAHIFNSIFESGKLPSEWKASNIYPIYKSGARSNVKNYRPVSLTSIFCKIWESIFKKVTMKSLEEN